MTGSVGPKVTIDVLMQRALEVPGLLSLAAGFTDNDLLPRKEVCSIVNDVLSSPAGSETLQYANPPGRSGLRRALCDYITTAEQATGATPAELEIKDVVITNGSQQALYLAAQTLCQPGDVILVEAPTYFVFLDLLTLLGVEAIAMPSRDDVLDPERLEGFFKDLKSQGRLERVRAVYLISYFSNPSGLSLDTERKRTLLARLREFGVNVPILEDAAYREMYFERPWPSPTLLNDETAEHPIVLMGTLTKTFATGLKVGYVIVRDERLRGAMLDAKRGQDFGTSNFAQAIVENAIVNGVYATFLTKMRTHYRDKCRILHDALTDHGLKELGWSWTQSEGGLYLWLTAPDGLRTTADSDFFNACIEEKVLYVPGNLCYVEGGTDKVRLSFGYLPTIDLSEAAARFVQAARKLRGTGS